MRRPRPAHKARRRTARQIAAAKKWNAAGRAAAEKARKARHGKLTPRQKAAVAKWSAAGRAARHSGQHHHHATHHKTGLAQSIYDAPVCCITAIAAHLQFTHGVFADDFEIFRLFELAAGDDTGAYMGDVLETIRTYGLSGWYLEDFWLTDPGLMIPGLIQVLKYPDGYHAVLALPGRDVSWGQEIARNHDSAESWFIQWAE